MAKDISKTIKTKIQEFDDGTVVTRMKDIVDGSVVEDSKKKIILQNKLIKKSSDERKIISQTDKTEYFYADGSELTQQKKYSFDTDGNKTLVEDIVITTK